MSNVHAPDAADASDTTEVAACKSRIVDFATAGGALTVGVADPNGFGAAPSGHRPADLLPGAKAVVVVGGAQPRAADWQSPNVQHMETTSTSDRISALGLKVAHFIEEQYGYYALIVPAGVDRGQQPFLSLMLAAELAGCGTRSLAGPILNPEHGFMYYSAVITTLPLPVDGPLQEPVCPAPECSAMWEDTGTTPCLATCPIEHDGCLEGSIEDGRIERTRYDRAKCTTRTQTYWVPGFQKTLAEALDEQDKEQRRMILGSTHFTRTLWSMTYSNVSQSQCFECMRVCPVGREHRHLK